MYQISREKMPELLAAVAKEMDLFLPVQNNGITNFGFWTEDAKVDLDTLKTVKSPKDAFFPQSEVLYSCYQKANKTSIDALPIWSRTSKARTSHGRTPKTANGASFNAAG